MIKKNRVFLVIITAIVILTTKDTIGDNFCYDLKDFYSTKLFAIETHLSILTYTKDISSEIEKEITALEEDRNIIMRRLKACEKYNLYKYSTKGYYKHLSRKDIDLIAERTAKKHRVDPQLIKSIIKAESNYYVYARSHAGAMGLMQLMPETAEDMEVENPWDPKENIEGGTKYFYLMLQEFKNVNDALIAYNAGPQVVRRGRMIPRESKHYVKNVLSHYRKIAGSESL